MPEPSAAKIYAQLMPVDFSSRDWSVDALCTQTDPELFFPTLGQNTHTAKQVCAACPVRSECLEFALTHRIDHGVWGGMSRREREQYSKTSAANCEEPISA